MKLLIRNAVIIDDKSGEERTGDVFVNGDVLDDPSSEAAHAPEVQVINAEGYYCLPGLIDLGAHLRDPGQTWKEDLYSAGSSAAKGGFTTVTAMPDTDPAVDTPGRFMAVMKKAAESTVKIIQAGAITVGREGYELCDMRAMAEAGVRVISDSPRSVMNSGLYKRALLKAARFGLKVFDRCVERDLVNGGCVNEDEVCRREGLPGICAAAENIMVARDLLLAKDTGVPVHISCVSTKESVRMIKLAKQEGVPVTADAAIHSLVLNSSERKPLDTNYKTDPPIRTEADRAELIKGLAEGTVDAISTCHSPHREIEKQTTMVKAPFGISVFENTFQLAYTELVKKKWISMKRLSEALSKDPAGILGLQKRGSLRKGADADLFLFDPHAEVRIDKRRFLSKGKNTPFDGMNVHGEILLTIAGGNIVFAADK